jgi:adenosylhomocysteine nucleosidase
MILDLHEVDRLHEFGLAGGLVDGINLGDCVVISDIYTHDAPNREDVQRTQQGLKQQLFSRCQVDILRFSNLLMQRTTTQVITGTTACGDMDIYSRELRDRIARESQAVAVNWESGAIVEVCALNDAPYPGVRILADKATEEEARPIPSAVWLRLEQTARAYVQTVKDFEREG